ncbi:hypothetical protein D3C86_1838430 [compost metagenome]
MTCETSRPVAQVGDAVRKRTIKSPGQLRKPTEGLSLPTPRARLWVMPVRKTELVEMTELRHPAVL